MSRVNLLPPEVRKARRDSDLARRIRFFAICGFLLLGGLYSIRTTELFLVNRDRDAVRDEQVLVELKAAGLDSLPGGGAEVFSARVRKKLGLPSPFDLRLGDPLAVAAMAVHYPEVPVIIPHFGAGLFREALMAASAAPNILLDTSSTNGWIRLMPHLTLRDVFARALDVVGPGRLLFGSDSSTFPRGWHAAIHDAQMEVLTDLDVSVEDQHRIFAGNFDRVFA